MAESRQNFWVGLFALCGLAALAVLIVLFGQSGFWTRSAEAYTINVRFQQATGVRPGTIATVGGIPVGRVVFVDFVDPARFDAGVDVEIMLDEGRTLPVGSLAYTSEPGLGMGRPPIAIEPGPSDGPALASGATIRGEISSAVESLVPQQIIANFDKTATRIAEAAAALTPVLEDLHEVMRPRLPKAVDAPDGPPGNLASAMARFDSTLKNFNDVFGDPEFKSRLHASIDNFHSMTEDGRVVVSELKDASGAVRSAAVDAKELINKTSQAVTRIEGNADQLTRDLREDLEIASRVLTHLDQSLEKIKRGEGTMGRLLTDERLYESLVLTFRRLAEATEEFRLLVQDWQKGKIKVGL